MQGSVQREFAHLERKINEQIQTPTFYENLYHAVEGGASLFSAIAKTKGHGWAAQIKDFTPEEQTRYTAVFEPYIPAILHFFDGDTVQSGGSEPHDMIDTVLDYVDKYDKGYKEKLMKFPSLYKLEQDSYPKDDIHLIPEIIRGPIRTSNPFIGKILDILKLPLHMILYMIRIFMDTARVALAAAGQEHQRQMLSIVLAVYEFLSGDWKKAILSIVGYFGTSAQLMGQYGKLFLIFYEKFDSSTQRSAIHGIFDSARTFLIGALAHIFQLTAPFEIRKKIVEIFKEIHEKKIDIDKILISRGYEPLPSDYDPAYDNPVTFLVMVSGTKLFHCSCEQQKIVEGLLATESSILSFMMILMGIPIDVFDRERMCGKKQCIDLVDLLPKSKVAIDAPPPTPDGTIRAEFDKWAEDTFHTMKGLLPSKDDFNKTTEEWGQTYDELIKTNLPAMQAKFLTKGAFIKAMQKWANKLKSAAAGSTTTSPVVASPVVISAASAAASAANAAASAAEAAKAAEGAPGAVIPVADAPGAEEPVQEAPPQPEPKGEIYVHQTSQVPQQKQPSKQLYPNIGKPRQPTVRRPRNPFTNNTRSVENTAGEKNPFMGGRTPRRTLTSRE